MRKWGMELVQEILGWIGSIAFAVCAAPQAYDSWKKGNSRGITWGFFILWSVGEVFTLLYILPTGKLPLIVNYLVNLMFLIVIGYYKVYPRKRSYKKSSARPNLRVVK